jgi:hypothetical protein
VGFGMEKKLVLVLLTRWSSVKLGGLYREADEARIFF